MNPWDIFAWVAAITCSLMLASIGIAVIKAAIKPTPRNTSNTIIRGARD